MDLASNLDGAMVYGRPFGLVDRSSVHAVSRKKFWGGGLEWISTIPFFKNYLIRPNLKLEVLISKTHLFFLEHLLFFCLFVPVSSDRPSASKLSNGQ